MNPSEEEALRSPLPAPPASLPTLDESHLGMPPRRLKLPLILFLATCFFTYAAGCYGWQTLFFGEHADRTGHEFWDWHLTFRLLRENWQQGLTYMACVMAILLAHEMGHFLMTVRYRIPSSYPIFIPIPMMFIGTMGAVIGMQGFRANRRQMFDIGIAGPLAGLVIAIPILCFGMINAEAVQNRFGDHIGDPLIVKLLLPILRPGLPMGAELRVNSLFMAGWVGVFITGLNMMPVSQLDGGHVTYGLFIGGAHVIARVFMLFAVGFVIISRQYSWIMMLFLISAIGVDHPPTANDNVPLGRGRTILGLLSLVIPVFCFTPYPLYLGW
jgi:membrane-associated protease RseP (regulator of RpoE activity)